METPIYREFKTVMEMVYILQRFSRIERSEIETQEFTQRFAQNMLKCWQNRKFCREYRDYEEALAKKDQLKSPKNKREAKLSKILQEVTLIDLACGPLCKDNKEIMRKQADTRLKYEKKLKDKELYTKFVADKKKQK